MASPSPSASERAPGTIVVRATVAQGPSAGGGGEAAPQARHGAGEGRAFGPPPRGKGTGNMQNVQAIIDLFGGLARLRHIRLEAAGFMPLVIEAVGRGVTGEVRRGGAGW